MPISISMIVVGTHLVVAVDDRLPAFDVPEAANLMWRQRPAFQSISPSRIA